MKVKVSGIPWQELVVDAEDLPALMKLFANVERFAVKYNKNSEHTYHIWEETTQTGPTFTPLSNAFYNVAKLAGKPCDD